MMSGVEATPTVSVVTPVYNGEAYLAECIESVLAQTYEDWEYVIVDNCSTDGSSEIAERYAKEDPRIRVHHSEEFRGPIQNWNHALRQISPGSKYCKVVHADDVLFPECLERMVALADEHPSVGVVGAYRLAGDRVDLDVLPYSTSVVSGHAICRHSLLGGRYVFGSPTSLLIRSSLIREREAFYNEAHLHADTEACYEVLQHSDFGFVHQVLTYTRKHNASITSAVRRANTWLPDHTSMLVKYGPVHLDDGELDRRLRQMLRRYNIQLLRSTVRGRPFRDSRFSKHQRRMLEEISESLDTLPTRRGASLKVWRRVFGLANGLHENDARSTAT
jgi:glycosyltransferase involved in cell wall biosynthesis